MTRTKALSLATAAAVVAVLAAGWFLLLSPKRAAIADLRSQQADVEQQQTQLRSQITMLKQQAADLPAQQRRLAAFRTKMPTAVELPSLVRGLTAIAQQSGATVTTIAPATPATPTPAATTGTATSPVAPTAPGTASSTYLTVPVSLTVQGSYEKLERFLDVLEKQRRSLLVSSVSVAPQASDAGASTTPTLQAPVAVSAFVSAPSATAGPVPSPAGASGSGS